MFLLVISEILGLFTNTLAADGKYSYLNRKNSQQPIRMQLYKKQNSFTEFFVVFLKSAANV